jgi:hypothetical protein
VRDVVNINSAVSVDATITSIDGRVVLEQAHASSLKVSSLAEGMYILKLTDAKGQVLKAEKILIQK